MYTQHFCNNYDNIASAMKMITDNLIELQQDIGHRKSVSTIVSDVEAEAAIRDYPVDVTEGKIQLEIIDAISYNMGMLASTMKEMCNYMRKVNDAMQDQDNSVQAAITYSEELENQIRYLEMTVNELTQKLEGQKSAFVLIGKRGMESEEAIPGHEFATLRQKQRQKKSEEDFDELPF